MTYGLCKSWLVSEIAMKILHLDPDDIDNPLSGGGPVRTYEIYKRLAQKHEVTVLTPTFEGSTSEIVRDNIRYIRLGRKIRDHGSSHHITFFFSLPKAVRQFDYDLLVEDFMPPMSTAFTPLWSKAPVVASIQWFFAEALSKQYKLPFFLGERYGVKAYKNFVVLTDKMRQLIDSRTHNKRIGVIANGVEKDLFAGAPEYGDFILFLGRVDLQQKGVDLLLQAYAKVPEAKRLPLVLAGHSFQQADIQKLIDDLQLGRWVSMVGKVAGPEKLDLLNRCRFVCIPSREETFGMVITESCACGKPVVLFDKAPMNEVAAPECKVVPPFDIDAYARAIESMLEASDSELQAWGERCRSWASQYDWDNIAQQQEAFYLQVLAGQR